MVPGVLGGVVLVTPGGGACPRPYSWMKIAFAVLAVVLLLAALALFQGR